MKYYRYGLISLWASVCFLVCLNTAFASETRVASMGNTGLFIHDNSNVVPFPGSIYLYGNQIIAEYRTKGDPNTFTAAVHFPFGDGAFGGVRLNRNIFLPVPQNFTTSLSLDQVNDFVMGLKVGESSLGIRASFAFKNNTAPVDTVLQTVDENASYYELAAGLSGAIYDIGAYFNLPKMESTYGAINQKWDGFGYGISARYFLGQPDAIMYVPVGIWNALSADLTESTGTSKTKYLEARFGVGIHYQVNKTNLVILGIEPFGLVENKFETSLGTEKQRITNFPAFYLGGETHAKNWLILRVGATHRTQENEVTSEPNNGTKTTVSTRDSQFILSVGAGFQIGKFLLDLDINNNFLFEGPEFISGHGAGQLEDFFNRISVTYTF